MENWREIRENAGLEQSDVVEATGIHKQTVSAFELGNRKSIKLRAYYYRLRGNKSDLEEAYAIEHNYIDWRNKKCKK